MNRIEQEIAAAQVSAVTADEKGAFQASFLFPESFSGFAGHFPGNPILPAIVELMTVVYLVGLKEGSRQRLVGVEDAKFLSPVRPDQEIQVVCRQRTLRGKLLYDAQLSVGGIPTASALLELAPEDAS